jgi:Fuc2NAc and GlcNAc transferase
MILFVVSALSLLCTLCVKKIAIKDIPNHRSSHTVPVPTGGGVAIVVSFFVGAFWMFHQDMIPSELFFAILSSLLLVAVGVVDDLLGLSPKIRFVAQLVTLVLAFYFLGVFERFSFVVVGLLLFMAIWLINLYNFMDGIDGYAGSEAVFVSIGAYLIYEEKIFLILIASVIGFLIFNWQRASIFMGDVGSTFLGFFFGVMALEHLHSLNDLLIWITLLNIFIFDASLTLLERIKNKENIFDAHRKHAFQRLVRGGFSHQRVVLLSMALNVAVLILLLLSKDHLKLLILLFVTYNVVLYIIYKMIQKRMNVDV